MSKPLNKLIHERFQLGPAYHMTHFENLNDIFSCGELNNYDKMGIQSIAMLALGCGLGGLNWSDVRSLIGKHLGSISDLDVYVYEPQKVQAQKKPEDSRRDGLKDASEGVAANPY